VNLRLVREPSFAGATLGVLFVDGRFECFVLEDVIRECAGPVASWKVPGKTAIPSGRYRVIITQSARFRRRLPLLVGVPGFTGIRIHPGNTIEDTEGCLLPGRFRAAQRVGDSRLAFEALFLKIDQAAARGEAIWIDVENPVAYGAAAA
jgi:hypothetical protein